MKFPFHIHVIMSANFLRFYYICLEIKQMYEEKNKEKENNGGLA